METLSSFSLEQLTTYKENSLPEVRFANPGSMRVSLNEALQDSVSDPRNGEMMKMLAMVKYGERAGSGLQGIFKTWQSVYHCVPKLEVTTSGGVDRTTLTLGFEGHQPDIEAMKLLYDNPDELIEVDGTPESKGESDYIAQNTDQGKGESKGESDCIAQNTDQSKGESKGESDYVAQNTDQSKGESNRIRVIRLLSDDGSLTLPEIAEKLHLSLGGVEKIVRQLKKEGILSRQGSTKAGKWIVQRFHYAECND